jgi:hypothetical protein
MTRLRRVAEMSFVDPGVRRHDVIGVHTFACWNVQVQTTWRIQVYVGKALAIVKPMSCAAYN